MKINKYIVTAKIKVTEKWVGENNSTTIINKKIRAIHRVKAYSERGAIESFKKYYNSEAYKIKKINVYHDLIERNK